MKFNPLKPELYVSNFETSLSFYRNILGFNVEYTRENPHFAFLSYQGSQLMIQQDDNDEDWHNGKPEYPFGRGINLEIDTTEIEKLINSLNSNNYPLKIGLKQSIYMENETEHGAREFLVMDPDGYLLRFSEKII